jgi:hypothetical protein
MSQAFRSETLAVSVRRVDTKYLPSRSTARRSLFSGISMATIDLDWPAQLKTCQIRIVQLEQKITSERQKIQSLSELKLNVKWTQCLLAMTQENLERAQSRRSLIENRIADRTANQHDVLESHPNALQLINIEAAAPPQ